MTNLKLKDDFDRIYVFFVMHAFLFMCAKFYELISFELSFFSFIGFILWGVFYRLFFKMLKYLHYSFWTMAFLSGLFLLQGLVVSLHSFKEISLFYMYLISAGLLAASCYGLFSPVFYPIVSWWEYDFRYRNDIECDVKIGDDELVEGRLIDLRRGAGGLSFFGEINTGEKVLLKPKYNDLSLELKAEIVSKRQFSIGRPYTYGLRFLFDNEDDKKALVQFQNFWQFERKHKKQSKFSG